jgi:N-acetylglucosaminyldiphosphoundecaprenol N-acetyl-beta-D-mannosaminyltransferase
MAHERNRITANVLGSHIDAVGWADCLDRIFTWASKRESRYVCMCNAHSVVTARRDPGFGEVINGADLAPPDGAPVAWRLRAQGHAGQQRISGPDLMWKCCARAAAEELPLFLYGGTAGVLRRLTARIARDFPRLQLAGCYAPPFRPLTPEEDALVARAIEDSGARIVLVGLGCPKQEAWAAAHRGTIHAVMIGVGAAFDFHAGVIARAPRWMRNAGLEWLHRLVTEPRRLWRRYLVTNTLFIAYLAAEVLGGGRKTAAGGR